MYIQMCVYLALPSRSILIWSFRSGNPFQAFGSSSRSFLSSYCLDLSCSFPSCHLLPYYLSHLLASLTTSKPPSSELTTKPLLGAHASRVQHRSPTTPLVEPLLLPPSSRAPSSNHQSLNRGSASQEPRSMTAGGEARPVLHCTGNF